MNDLIFSVLSLYSLSNQPPILAVGLVYGVEWGWELVFGDGVCLGWKGGLGGWGLFHDYLL